MGLVYVAFLFAIIGSILFLLGSSLPVASIVTFVAAVGCFIIVVVIVVIALCIHQREGNME